ncbi:hypothetical protein BGZ63DRAFT_188681 [Mariannaea sp. PMI_226]|nr:hypothetical protein BGZ63DRAFT_188681 [Mariannaea sp. PMI_226]
MRDWVAIEARLLVESLHELGADGVLLGSRPLDRADDETTERRSSFAVLFGSECNYLMYP